VDGDVRVAGECRLDAPGEVLFFKDVIVAKELLERAERVAKK
jgi:hypothetical protein